jgi:hypothetical protein
MKINDDIGIVAQRVVALKYYINEIDPPGFPSVNPEHKIFRYLTGEGIDKETAYLAIMMARQLQQPPN